MKNLKKPEIVSKKLKLPFILVTTLFILWGFANAVTDPMVQAFKKVLELSNSEAAWVQMAFYGGYFCMALPASMLMRKYSYKTCILFGLVMAIVGSALLPKLQGIVFDFGGRGVADILIFGVSEVNFSFLLPLLCFFYLSWYGFRVSNKNTISP